MEVVNIYLSGAMSGLTLEEQTKWRKQIHDAILYEGHDMFYKPVFIDPTMYYGFDDVRHKSEREAMNFDLYKVRESDLMVVNFNKPDSLGTAMEMAIAYEYRIPIIGLNKDGVELHPWLECMCDRICDDMREVVTHVVEFYLK